MTRWTLAAAGVSGLAIGASLAAIAPPGSSLLLVAIVVWFTLPGVWLARIVYRDAHSPLAPSPLAPTTEAPSPLAPSPLAPSTLAPSTLAPSTEAPLSTPQHPSAPLSTPIVAWCIGPVWGYGLSSVALLALWVAGLRGPLLLIAPALAMLVVLLLGRVLRGMLVPPVLDRRDIIAALLLLLLVPAIVGRPFARVGEQLPDGRAYRAYFTADFIWRMAVAAELAKGDMPPQNPFYRGDELRYYWLAHLLPAAEYRELHRRVTLEQVLLVNSVALDLAFIVFLYGFVRHWVRSPSAAAAGCACTVLFSSFEGTERLWVLWQTGGHYESLRYVNIDAVTRWFYLSLPVDGLHRLLMYQPHHSTGYALGLSALLAYARARAPQRAAVAALAGSLLAGCLLLSTFSAIMLTAMTAIVGATLLVATRQWRGLLIAAMVGAVPLALATWLAMTLKYVDRAGSLIRILVNPQAVTNPLTAICLSFGPMLIFAIWGIAIGVRKRVWALWIVGVIVLVSFVFYFFVDVRDHQYVYVGWRAGHMLFVAFAVLAGFALQELATSRRRVRVAAIVGVVFMAALAAPTLAIDLYNTQDLDNRAEAASFTWTLVLSPDELQALQWIRRNTRPEDLIQVDPFVRDSYTWAYIPAFAERRMAAGLPISMVPLDKYIQASNQVRDMYDAADPVEAHRRARRLFLDYVLVGPPERGAHPRFEDMIRARPDLFRPLFQSGSVSIYFVDHGVY